MPVVQSPSLNVVKSSTTNSIASAGQTVPYTFTVTNTGNVTLTGIKVADPMCSAAPAYGSGDTNNDSQLQITETWVYACNHTVTQAEVDAGGDLSNTVTADSSQTGPDTATLDIPVTQTPAINVVKEVSTDNVTWNDTTVTVNVGAAVYYRVRIANTGNISLTGLTVDDGMPACTLVRGADLAGNNDTILNVGEEWSYTCSVTALAGTNNNTATADTDQTLPDTDSASYFGSSPSINVAKSSTTTSITDAGQVVPYTFTVTNTGNITLTGVTVTDLLCDSDPARQSGDTNNDNQLQTTETWIYTCAHTVTQAEVNAGGSLGNTVNADSNESPSDSDSLDIPVAQSPGINIAKTPATQSVVSGGTASFTLTVTNTGNVTLTGVTVTDAQCTTGPTLTGGDANSDNQLQRTETWTYSCSVANVLAAFTNTASVTTSQGATDSDTADVTLTSAPAMDVVKSSTTASITSAGQVVPYTFTLTNTGNTTLTGVTVADPLCDAAPAYQSGDTNNDGQLQTTETWSYTCNHTVTQAEVDAGGNLSNTVTADSNQAGPVIDRLDIPVAQTPGVNIEKTPASQTVVSGGTAKFTLTVTNTGNVTLTGVTVSDVQCTTGPTRTGGDTNNDNQLQKTETWTYSCLVQDVSEDFTNTADVRTEQQATDSDTASVTIVSAPALNVVKEVSGSASGPWDDSGINVTVGETVYYRVRVENTGNTTLTGLTVNDGMPGCTLVREADITGNDDNVFEAGEEWAYACSIVAVLSTNNNTATADSNETAPDSDTASYTGTAASVSDPAISKSGNPATASVGESVTFTLTVTNQGNAPAADVIVTDTLPAMFDVTAVTVTGAPLGTLVDVTPDIGTGPAPYTVVVTLGGDLGVEDIVTIRIVTTVNGQGNPPINNTASLTTSAETDVIANNADSAAITIRPSGQKTKKVVLPATGYAQDTRTILPGQPAGLSYASTDVILEIPALGLKIPVVGVPRKNATWNVDWLGNQAGWLEGSAFPSWNGNSVLTGHVYHASGLPGPFVNLNKLKYGDRIIIRAYGETYTFAVQTNEVVNASDSTVMRHEEKPWLTLLTCKDYDEKTGAYRNRVVVRAILVNVEQE